MWEKGGIIYALHRTGKSFFFAFSGITHSRKKAINSLGKCTDAAGIRRTSCCSCMINAFPPTTPCVKGWPGYIKESRNRRFTSLISGWSTRACLKNHSHHLHYDAYASYSPLCVIFTPNSGYIARYAPFIWCKSPTNCDAHLTESIFQTRSSLRIILTLFSFVDAIKRQ